MNIENLKNLLNSIKENKIPCFIELRYLSRALRPYYCSVMEEKLGNTQYDIAYKGMLMENGMVMGEVGYEIIDVKQDYLISKGFHMQNDKTKAYFGSLEIVPISEITKIRMDDSFLENNFEVL